MNTVDIGTARIAYRIFGSGPIKIVIEGSLNSCNAEWWNFCSDLIDLPVLVYDRAGYGNSTKSSLDRTPKNIVYELSELLNKFETEKELIIVGHSQGGLYAALFALVHPEKTKAVILLDPLSLTDGRFKTELNEKEFYSSGVEKTKALKMGKVLTGMRFGFIIRGLLKKAPPFYYEKYDKEAEKYILSALTQKKQYETALLEYENAHKAENLKVFIGKIQKPVLLIRHNDKKMIEEIMYFGNCEKAVAEKVEYLWQSVMRDMLQFSDNAEEISAENSSHYIHLTDRKLVIDKIKGFI